MRIYDGSPRQDFEEVFRSIGAFIDQRGMHEILLVEAPDGFIVQGIVTSGEAGGAWSESMGHQEKETLTFLDDDIARFMEESLARRGSPGPEPARDAGFYEIHLWISPRIPDVALTISAEWPGQGVARTTMTVPMPTEQRCRDEIVFLWGE